MMARVRIRMRPGRTVAAVRRGRRLVGRGAVDSADPEAVEELIKELMVSAKGGRPLPGAAVIEIQSPLVQIRRLHGLPPVNARNLKRLIAGGSERFFRMNGAPLVSDGEWNSGHWKGRQEALAAAIHEPFAVALMEAATRGGVRLDAVIPRTGSANGLNLLPPRELLGRARRTMRWGVRAVVAGAAMWGAVAAAAIVGLVRERRALTAELAGLEPGLTALRGVERELGMAADAIQAVHATAARRGEALTALAAISAALPDSTYLESFSFGEGDTIRITGATRFSARLLASLDDASGLAGGRLEGTPLRTSINGRSAERFSIVLRSGAR